MRRISSVMLGSPAQRHRIQPGDVLLLINGEPVLDEIDYQALTARRHVKVLLQSEDGQQREVDILKDDATPLGLEFDDSLIGNPRTCSNNCVFCFVAQMPPGMRESLYVKDDDWRLSLLTGSYITLTNVSEREFARIIKRRASPLYISVHSTDEELRTEIMGNRHAGLLMERLRRLRDAGIHFHCQLVLCPGLNDGPAMVKSLNDLLSLHPHARSVALVPVGLTRHREGLSPILPYTLEKAREVLALAGAFQEKTLRETGTRFAFAADEFFAIAGLPVPEAGAYEDFPQLENGVGMLRKFEDELAAAHAEDADAALAGGKRTVLLPCGTAVFPYAQAWLARYKPDWVEAVLVPIRNEMFGETVTVSGLIGGRDLIAQTKGIRADEVLIVSDMLNSEGTMFLDDVTPQDVSEALGMPLRVFRNDGWDFYAAISGRKTEDTAWPG